MPVEVVAKESLAMFRISRLERSAGYSRNPDAVRILHA
jgi:hypothetical protein